MSGKSCKPLSIEFLGMPGVGKSEMAHRLWERLDEAGVPVAEPSYQLAHGIGRPRRILRKLGIVAGESLRNPSLVWRSVASVRSTGQRQSLFGSLKTAFNWILVSALSRRARGWNGVSLFDEGLFQGLWSLGLEGDLGRIEGLVSRLHELAALPDYLVVSEASPATVEGRVRAREDNDSRLDSRLDAEPELFERGLETLAAIRGRAEHDLRSMRVLVMNNETGEDLERAVEALTELVAEHGS